MRLVIVAGEASGDHLGEGLIEDLRPRVAELQVAGVAGPAMRAAGCAPWADVNELAVMGLTEVLGSLPRLLKLRRRIREKVLEQRPDVFVGIDAPDFNLALERHVRRAGIRTVHYVSPSVWAWRSYRVRKLSTACDLVLALFPFEQAFYDKHDIPARFVGHPLARELEWDPDVMEARRRLGLPLDKRVLAILPGSRRTEYSRLIEPFVQTASLLHRADPNWRFIVPVISSEARLGTLAAIQRHSSEDLFYLFDGQSRECMAAADSILLASGTATLEAMLIGRPMVVAYRLAGSTFRILRHLVRVPWFSLPNLLSERRLVPEFVQHDVEPVRLAQAVVEVTRGDSKRVALMDEFACQRERLIGDMTAAEALLELG